MALGRVPGLRLDRTGVALLGLIVLLASEDLTLDEAGRAVDMPTIALLFALMIVSAQFENSGFYGWVANRVTHAAKTPKTLLAVLVAVTGLLSAVLTNDVVVFALTPLVCAGLMHLGLNARPYLIAMAGAANAGSAATLIGNPQNILLGQAGGLPFWNYVLYALPPSIFAMLAVYVGVLITWRRTLRQRPMVEDAIDLPAGPDIDRFQIAKAFAAVAMLVALFLTPFPRELSALAVAGFLLLSKRMASRDMIGAADWHLLLLFVCLFGVTAAFAKTGIAQEWLQWLAAQGVQVDHLPVLAPLTLIASNTIGNVPVIILLLKLRPDLPQGVLAALALLSTFAGNLLLTGSLCNIIVAERAQAMGARLSFMDFARSGIPMTLAAIAVCCAWLIYTGLVSL
jgi:Na+/H+ antiporter NhaD/arsenite permease-like protein